MGTNPYFVRLSLSFGRTVRKRARNQKGGQKGRGVGITVPPEDARPFTARYTAGHNFASARPEYTPMASATSGGSAAGFLPSGGALAPPPEFDPHGTLDPVITPLQQRIAIGVMYCQACGAPPEEEWEDSKRGAGDGAINKVMDALCMPTGSRRIVKDDVARHVATTADLAVDHPLRFSRATVNEQTDVYLKVLSGSPSEMRIREVVKRYLASLETIRQKRGFWSSELERGAGHRAKSRKGGHGGARAKSAEADLDQYWYPGVREHRSQFAEASAEKMRKRRRLIPDLEG